jgi:hypothetical protein
MVTYFACLATSVPPWAFDKDCISPSHTYLGALAKRNPTRALHHLNVKVVVKHIEVAYFERGHHLHLE